MNLPDDPMFEGVGIWGSTHHLFSPREVGRKSFNIVFNMLIISAFSNRQEAVPDVLSDLTGLAMGSPLARWWLAIDVQMSECTDDVV